jgi:O-acetyl-ADP-ribose deacetylase (regulator of RNase III)
MSRYVTHHERSAMKQIAGDLLKLAQEGVFDVIAHGCNCFCTMGAGVAKGVATYFPQPLEADRKTLKRDRSKLGTCTVADVQTTSGELRVVNAYTQYDFRAGATKLTTPRFDHVCGGFGSRAGGSGLACQRLGLVLLVAIGQPSKR